MTFPRAPKPEYPNVVPWDRRGEFARAYQAHWQNTPLHQRLMDKMDATIHRYSATRNSSNYNRAAEAYEKAAGDVGTGGGMGRTLRLLHEDD